MNKGDLGELNIIFPKKFYFKFEFLLFYGILF